MRQPAGRIKGQGRGDVGAVGLEAEEVGEELGIGEGLDWLLTKATRGGVTYKLALERMFDSFVVNHVPTTTAKRLG